jgi:hypothetical protein
METVRETWTDQRLDDFRAEVNRRFDNVDREVHGLRSEMNARFDALQRTLFQGSVLVVVALIGLIATQL